MELTTRHNAANIGTIEINRLRIKARHGVFSQEHAVGNIFEVSIKIICPMEKALLYDALEGTISYAEIIDVVKEIMRQPSQLIEHVAYSIKKSLLAAYPQILGGEIRVAKLQPPVNAELEEVAVTIPV
ncbi:MAG: dihydroneopterin aldolase [Duncaniella sp.]|nr:dihydroneopterin aldolase [Duncaniella sp.]